MQANAGEVGALASQQPSTGGLFSAQLEVGLPQPGGGPANLPPGQQPWATGGPPPNQYEPNLFNPSMFQAHPGGQHQANGQAALNLLQSGGHLVGQPINSLIPNQPQGPTLNMIMQSMQAQGSLNGMLPHSHLQSPPNSMGQGLFFLPTTGRMDPGRPDIAPSPNGLPQPPQPAQTPPGPMLDDRNWNPNMFLGRFPSMDNKSMDEQMKQHHQQQQTGGSMDMFPMDAGFASNFNGMTPDRVVQVATAMNQWQNHGQFMVPNNSNSPPPMTYMTQMPPRPRPEGGQDPSPNFLQQEQQHEMKSRGLVIDSWTDEDNEKATLHQQPFGGRDEAKDDKPIFNSGWGAPPPANPGDWGGNKPMGTTSMGNAPLGTTTSMGNAPMGNTLGNAPMGNTLGNAPMGNTPMVNTPMGNTAMVNVSMGNTPMVNVSMGTAPNWQQPPPFQPMHNTSQPPPNMDMGRGRGGLVGGGMMMPGGHMMQQHDGMHIAAGRGRGQFDYSQDRSRGRGMRGGGARGSYVYRGRGMSGGNFHEREQGKEEGKQSAIAETIAMMKKMRMEDVKKKKDADARREQRKEMGLPVAEINYEESEDDRYGNQSYNGRGRGRGMGMGRGRGGRGGMPPGVFQGPPPGPGMMLPPHAIPPFPGLEGFMPPQMTGFPPGASFAPPFHPGMCMQPPGNFPGGRGGFPRPARGAMAPLGFPPHFPAHMMGAMPRGAVGQPRGRGRGGRGGFKPRDDGDHMAREDGEGGEHPLSPQDEEGLDPEPNNPETQLVPDDQLDNDTPTSREPIAAPPHAVAAVVENEATTQLEQKRDTGSDPPGPPPAESPTH